MRAYTRPGRYRGLGKWAGSSVGGMGYPSGDECQEPDSCIDSPLRRNEVVAQTSRDVEATEFAIDGPVILGRGCRPRMVPAVGLCSFSVTRQRWSGSKRIADAQMGKRRSCADRSSVFSLHSRKASWARCCG